MTFNNFKPEVSDPDGIKVEEILKTNIKTRLRHEKSICISLSGGVDSSLLLALIRDCFPEKKIVALTVRGNVDETERANDIAEQFNAEHIILEFPNLLKQIPIMVSLVDEPRWNVYPYFTRLTSKQYGDIIVNGDGADELFAGYIFRYKQFQDFLDNDYSKVDAYLYTHRNDWIDEQEEIFGENVNFSWQDIKNNLEVYFDNELDPISQILLADYNGKYLYDYIPTNKSIDTKLNVDSFYPFTDNKLTNLATHLPIDEKFVDGVGKLPLRKIAERHNLILNKEKLGFSLDIQSCFLNHIDSVNELLSNRNLKIYKDGLINYEWVQKYLNVNIHDTRIINKLFQILALHYKLESKY